MIALLSAVETTIASISGMIMPASPVNSKMIKTAEMGARAAAKTAAIPTRPYAPGAAATPGIT